MNRYRWFRAEWPISMRLLAKRLKAKQFAEGAVDGFVIDRVRDDFLEARYNERFEFEEVVTDPFGKELTFRRVEFRQSTIRASSGTVGLELQDAPRSTHGLVSRLAEVNDFSLAISPISVDVIAWATDFQRISRSEALVDSLQIGELELEPGISAKVVLKGVKDVRNASKALTARRRHKLEKIQLRFDGPYKGKVILANQGAATVSSDRSDGVASILRDALAGLLK
jgi:hypothetical protein